MSTNYKGFGLSVVHLPSTAEFKEIEVIQGGGLYSSIAVLCFFMRMASLEHYLPLLISTVPVNTVSLIISESLSV